MNKVSINGRTYTAPDGCSVSVVGNKVYFINPRCEFLNSTKPIPQSVPITISACIRDYSSSLLGRIVFKLFPPFGIAIIDPSNYEIYFVIHNQNEYKYNLIVNFIPMPEQRECMATGIDG